MEVELLETFIQAEALVIIPVLYLIGLFLRQTPSIPVWTHAWINLLIAIVVCMFMFGANVNSFIQGVLVAGASVLMKELIHQTADQTHTPKDDNKL